MEAPEAITELTRYVNEPYSKLHPYFTKAVRLSIQALQHVQACPYFESPIRDEILAAKSKK